MADRIREWLEEQANLAIERDTQDLERRSHAALDAGIEFIMCYLTTPPMAGTKEREDWERKCDRCGTVVPYRDGTVSIRIAFRHADYPLYLVIAAMLCDPCVVELGGDPSALPQQGPHTHEQARATVALVNTHLPGAAFGIVMPEPAEVMEHAVEQWESRIEKERE